LNDFSQFDFPWTSEQVLGLSQHDYHIKTSREMAFAHKWQALGYKEGLIWGTIPVKDKPGIQTRVALGPLHFACSCTSYQHPCNHALGILLLYLSKPQAFQTIDPPLWAQDARSLYTFSEDTSTDTRRWSRMQAGMKDLEQWLLDSVREGLESLRGKTQSFQQMADRLVDAQLNEVAKDVRQLSGFTVKNPSWHEELLASLGRLYLLVEGFKRFETLSKENQADLAMALGWLPKLQDGQIISDRWHILGKRLEVEVGRKVQRLWLWSEAAQVPALLVEVLHGKHLPSTKFLVGGVLEATLQFYPSSTPLRAEITQLSKIVQPHQALRAFTSIKQAHMHYTETKTKNPWLKQVPIKLQKLTAHKLDSWNLQDSEGYILPLPNRFSYGWHLQSLSPKDLWIFGEYDGQRLLPLSVWGNGRLIEMHTLRGVS
jgi:hypothetical protein